MKTNTLHAIVFATTIFAALMLTSSCSTPAKPSKNMKCMRPEVVPPQLYETPGFLKEVPESTELLLCYNKSDIPSGITINTNTDSENIKETISDHIDEIKGCYKGELKNTPNIHGKVEVTFTAEANGKISACDIKVTTLNNKTVEKCICKKIKSWKFKPLLSGNSSRITYPFTFKEDIRRIYKIEN